MRLLILLMFLQTPGVRIKFNPLECDSLLKKYSVKSYILGNVEIRRKGDEKLIPLKINEENPEIKKFTRSVAREYFEKDIFKDVLGMNSFTCDYRITIPSPGLLPIKGKTGVLMAVDPWWSRVIFGYRGGTGLYSFGSYGEEPGKMVEPRDIEVIFPYVYISDCGGKISVWKIRVDTFENGDYHFTGFDFYKDISYSGFKFPAGLGTFGTEDTIKDNELLYVADQFKGKIYVFDKEGNFIRGFGKRWRVWPEPPVGCFCEPTDVKVDDEGNVYVIDRWRKRRIVAFRDTFISDLPFYWRAYDFDYNEELFGLELDSEGRVYVGWEKRNENMEVIDCKIIRFLPELSGVDWIYGTNGTDLGQFPSIRDIYIKGSFLVLSEGWGWNKGIAYFLIPDISFDNVPPVAKILSPPDSTFVNKNVPLYIHVEDNNLVKNYVITYEKIGTPSISRSIFYGSQDAKFLAGFWQTDTLPEGLYRIILSAYDLANNFSSDTHLVYVGEPSPVLIISGKGRKPGKFRLPCDVAVDSEFIYITDSQNDRIQKFKKTGGFVWSIGKTGKNKGEFIQPDFISYLNGKIFVSDRNNSRVQVFDTLGNYLTECGGRNLFNHTGGVAFDRARNMYISDIHNHRINVFDSSFNYISSFGEYGDTIGKFNQPHGIFILDTLIYIADRQNNRVQLFNLKGNFIKVIGEEGLERGKFSHPYDLVIDKDTSLYVSDQHNNRIQKFDKFSNVLLEIYGEKLGDSLKQPKGLSIDEKFLYVMDTYNNRLVVFPLKIGFLIDSLAKYNVKPGDMLVVYERGKIYFILNVKSESKKMVKACGISNSGSGYVEIKIFDILGRRLGYLLRGFYPEGKMKVLLNKDLKAGVYFLNGEISGNRVRKKIIVFR